MDPKSGMQTSKVDVLGDVVAQANFKLAQTGPQPGYPHTYLALNPAPGGLAPYGEST